MTMPQHQTDPNLALDALLATLREALVRTPHARGDHTDLCRHHNAGMPPATLNHCHCHVARIVQTLATPMPRAEAILETVRAARHACHILADPTSPATLQALHLLQTALQRLDATESSS
ncbi:MAG: hypothetical protein H7833_12685 [Magnetococcus sp. DMHC-1]|nr:hypothetical protein [Magnetococcales bacterium]